MAKSDFLHPLWQKKRLEILERDNFTCYACGSKDKTLHVHHVLYCGKPWNTPNEYMQTLCEDCHAALGSHPKGGVGYSFLTEMHRSGGNARHMIKCLHCPLCGSSDLANGGGSVLCWTCEKEYCPRVDKVLPDYFGAYIGKPEHFKHDMIIDEDGDLPEVHLYEGQTGG